MITVILLVIAIVIGVLYFKAKWPIIEKEDTWVESAAFWKIIATLVIGVLIALVQPFSLERVDAGNVGIKVDLVGDNRGIGKFEYKTGRIIINEWTSKLYEFPTFQQSVAYPEQNVITRGGFPVTIHPTFNYSLKAGDIGDMFSNLRRPINEVEQGWLQNAIIGAFNDVVNTWTIDDIFNNREKLESQIVVEVNKRVSKWFIISQLRTNIIPPKSLVESIERKTKAIQDVQVAENEARVAIAQGDKKIATARADSSATVIEAAANAMAIKLKQEQITPVYVEYIRWLNADPTVERVPSTMLGSNTPFIYSPK